MKIKKTEIKELIQIIGFKPQDGEKDIYYKNYPKHKDYILKIDFENEKIEYGSKIKLGDLTTSNFEHSENFVVLECVDRVLEKGYAPNKLSLEHKWPMGRKEKGKLDILVFDKDDKAYLMIECKTWGDEYEKEKKKMQRDGGQLFSYFQQDTAAQYLCLYASRVSDGKIDYSNEIVKVDEQWNELNNQKEVFDHWNKNFKDNGIFEDWANAYDVEIKAITRNRLKELTEEDSGRIFNQFAEILRHNVVSDKPNAFNKIFNLFLCKIVDEDRKDTEELDFQWKDDDTDESLQNRLNDLYKKGMKDYLTKEVTDYNQSQVSDKLIRLDQADREQILKMFSDLRLRKNPEFAFKEVFDEKSFRENAVVVREVVELLQPYQIRYGHKQQFLGDFFELLLSTGIKQEAGQFFTPVPIAKFIISSLPIRELINKNIDNDKTQILPYIIDYAAGSGHFLTEAMDEVQNIIQEIDETKQRPSVKRNLSSWKINPFDWAYDYVYGIEADYRLVKTAKVSCFLNGDGLANVIHADGLDHFKNSTDYKGKLKEVSKDDPKDNGVFDILVANPPYSVSSFKNTLKNGEESFNLFNRLTDDSSEIESLFIERTKQLLKPGGWAGIILPSSILSNSGIYTDAREVILKYFSIKAIAEFGSNTFMATGTNTVTLFLERRANNDWKKIETAIKKFFEKPKEATINGIEKAFGKYIEEVFEDVSLQDYFSLINKKPNETISKQEFFIDYKAWFNGLTEIKNLKKKHKSVLDKLRVKLKKEKDEEKKAKTQKEIEKLEIEQPKEITRLFYKKVFSKEQDKMLYFFLAQPQQTVLIKVGEKQAEKDFIGYEFSSRRGHEGIKMYRDNGKPSTKLYDEDNHLNEEKANSYIYHAFLGEQKDIIESLQNNLSTFDLTELIDFKKLSFEKAISINAKKKVKVASKWPVRKLGDNLITLLDERRKPVTKRDRKKGPYPYYGATGIIDYVADYIFDERLILLGEDGAKWGAKENSSFIVSGKYWVNNHAHILKVNDELIKDKYLVEILNQFDLSGYITGLNVPKLNQHNLLQIRVPLPPKSTQDKIIIEIDAVEQKEKAGIEKIERLREDISSVINRASGIATKLKVITSKIGSGATPKGGNSSYQSSGISLIRSQNIYDYGFVEKGLVFINDEQAKKLDNVNVEKNDVLFNITGASITRCCIVPEGYLPARVNQHVSIIRTNDKALPKYVQMVLVSTEYKNQLLQIGEGATSRQAITKQQLEEFKIPVPSISEQQKIVNKINKLETEIDRIESELATMDEQKEKVLKKYLE
ncbi:restriction endonuclease subunit S [Flavobacteriaceae bacterium S356]|uniref:Restriction endonuclease subunit S n=1 Tax=Asprobacillus argus TaxID=3076534 RepID=A0ABU3LJ02_9FLAO|nr:restriction endonuclease subunit S [Flavobacteriaceae bacterium S356]